MENLSGNVSLDSGVFLISTEQFERANQIVSVSMRTSIYGQRRLHSNSANIMLTDGDFRRLYQAGYETSVRLPVTENQAQAPDMSCHSLIPRPSARSH